MSQSLREANTRNKSYREGVNPDGCAEMSGRH